MLHFPIWKSRNLSSWIEKSFSFSNWRYIIWVLPVKKLIDGKFLAKVFAKLEIIFLNSKLGERFHLVSQESQLKMLWHFQITISHLGWDFRIIFTRDYDNIQNIGWYIGLAPIWRYQGLCLSHLQFLRNIGSNFCDDTMWIVGGDPVKMCVRTLSIYKRKGL